MDAVKLRSGRESKLKTDGSTASWLYRPGLIGGAFAFPGELLGDFQINRMFSKAQDDEVSRLLQIPVRQYPEHDFYLRLYFTGHRYLVMACTSRKAVDV